MPLIVAPAVASLELDWSLVVLRVVIAFADLNWSPETEFKMVFEVQINA
jgi:hypothetical protein